MSFLSLFSVNSCEKRFFYSKNYRLSILQALSLEKQEGNENGKNGQLKFSREMISECRKQENASVADTKSMEVCLYYNIQRSKKTNSVLKYHFSHNVNIEYGRTKITCWKMYACVHVKETQFCRLNKIKSNYEFIPNTLIHLLCFNLDGKWTGDCRTYHILFRTVFWYQSSS